MKTSQIVKVVIIKNMYNNPINKNLCVGNLQGGKFVMAIVQEAFDIPEDIMTMISTGVCIRIGGVVRYAYGPKKGQIVKLLKPIDLESSEQTQGVSTKILEFAKDNKKALIIVGVTVGVVAVGAVGAGVYHKVNNREPETVAKFRTVLKEYIDAIRTANLDLDLIDNLMNSIEELKDHKKYEKFNIKLSTEELDLLVNRIYDYTVKFAKDNGIELTNEEQDTSDSTIINLQNYLSTQKRIFETVS